MTEIPGIKALAMSFSQFASYFSFRLCSGHVIKGENDLKKGGRG